MTSFISELEMKYGRGFFEEEVRCDYRIEKKLKQIWAVTLDLYEKFQEVCEKHNLRYYAICGTLLGAVRHKGFIPWDDDIDIAMPREDYERFFEIGMEEFEFPHFLQTPYTDKSC